MFGPIAACGTSYTSKSSSYKKNIFILKVPSPQNLGLCIHKNLLKNLIWNFPWKRGVSDYTSIPSLFFLRGICFHSHVLTLLYSFSSSFFPSLLFDEKHTMYYTSPNVCELFIMFVNIKPRVSSGSMMLLINWLANKAITLWMNWIQHLSIQTYGCNLRPPWQFNFLLRAAEHYLQIKCQFFHPSA